MQARVMSAGTETFFARSATPPGRALLMAHRCKRSCVLVSRENRVPAHSDVVLREALKRCLVATTRLPGSSPTDFIWMVMQPWHGSRLAHLKWAYLPHSDSLP